MRRGGGVDARPLERKVRDEGGGDQQGQVAGPQKGRNREHCGVPFGLHRVIKKVDRGGKQNSKSATKGNSERLTMAVGTRTGRVLPKIVGKGGK